MLTISATLELLKAYLAGNIAPESDTGLEVLFEKYPGLQAMLDNLNNPDELEGLLKDYAQSSNPAAQEREQRLLTTILSQIEKESFKPAKTTIKLLYRYAVAAAVLIALGFGFWKFQHQPQQDDTHVFELAQELMPGGNKAMLTSSDGTSLTLNEDRMGIVMGKDITYDDGTVLLADKENKTPILTLTTPKGGQYQISLADGTKVWLNADSKLRYPKVFTAGQRRVELEGEAYFEVASNPKKPFIVQTAYEEVKVLGTHFNVNAYGDEQESKVSLLEGKVEVSLSPTISKQLSPGQQSIVRGDHMRVQSVNMEESIAWKNGEFMFNNENLGTALRQVARWYAIDIEVDPALAGITLWGSVSRLESFDKVLKIIKMTDDNIKINLEGRRVRLMK